jgi:methylthioribose-1-phosphate isomerase
MRTVDWDNSNQQVLMIDQRLLPGEYRVVSLEDYHQVVDAIRKMVVRGAPAIGASSAFGMALAANASKSESIDGMRKDLSAAAEELIASSELQKRGISRMRKICEMQCWMRRNESLMKM